MPRPKARKALLRTLKPIFRRHRSGPLRGFSEAITPIVRGVGAVLCLRSLESMRFVRSPLASTEGAASSGHRAEATRLWLEAVE